MSSGVGPGRGLDPMLLWLWGMPAAAALIRPLAWEPPYAVDVALKRQKKKKKESDCSGSGPCGGAGLIPSLAQWVKGSSVAAAEAEIQSLARELPYAVSLDIKKKKWGTKNLIDFLCFWPQ